MNKQRLFLLCLACCISLRVAAQDSIVIYDMTDTVRGFINRPRYIREGSSVGILYVNVNPFCFQSNTTFKSVDNQFTDGGAEAAKVLGMTKSVQSEEQKSTENITKKPVTTTTKKSGNKKATTTTTEVNFITTPDNIEKRITDRSIAQLSQKEAIVEAIQQELNNTIGAINVIHEIILMDTVIQLAVKNANNTSVLKMKNQINSQLSFEINRPTDIRHAFEVSLSAIQSSLPILNRRLQQLADIGNELKKDALPEFQSNELQKMLTETIKKLNETYNGDGLNKLRKSVTLIIDNYITVTETRFSIFGKTTGIASGDYMELSDELKDKSGNTIHKFEAFKIKTFGGHRIDFSIGIATTFGLGINGTDYSLRKNPHDSTIGPDTALVILHKSQSNRELMFSPVAMIHYYRNSTRNINPMLSFGVAPDFSTLANSKLFLGLSLGLQTSNNLLKRMVLSGGVAAGYADALKEKYKDWNNYSRFGDIGQDELTEKVLKGGFFLALSCNLGGTGH